MFPGQPVADLETYMQSLEKKQQSVEKMVAKLGACKEDACKKYLGCSLIFVCLNKVHATIYHGFKV